MEEALTFYKHCYSRLTSDAVQIDVRSHSQVRAFATLVNFKLIKIYLTVAPYYQRDFGLKQEMVRKLNSNAPQRYIKLSIEIHQSRKTFYIFLGRVRLYHLYKYH